MIPMIVVSYHKHPKMTVSAVDFNGFLLNNSIDSRIRHEKKVEAPRTPRRLQWRRELFLMPVRWMLKGG
jgi:hypothetical protein